jgi:hypothetical protein
MVVCARARACVRVRMRVRVRVIVSHCTICVFVCVCVRARRANRLAGKRARCLRVRWLQFHEQALFRAHVSWASGSGKSSEQESNGD